MARAGTASGTSLGWAGKVPKPARVRKMPKLFQSSGKAAQGLTRGLALLLLRLDPKLHPKRTGICTEKWEWVRKPQTLPGSGKIPRRFHCPKFFFFPPGKSFSESSVRGLALLLLRLDATRAGTGTEKWEWVRQEHQKHLLRCPRLGSEEAESSSRIPENPLIHTLSLDELQIPYFVTHCMIYKPSCRTWTSLHHF